MVQTQEGSIKQSESGEFFVPKITGTGLDIRIGLSLIEDLGFATIEGLKAVPRRGLEIGGILLGQVDAAQKAILIEHYEEVESEHLYGPAWLLSPKDHAAFRRTFDRLRGSGSQQLRPVGFYRSQTRDGLSFNDQDKALMQEMFAGQPALCLLVKPSIAEPSVAELGMMTENSLQPVGAVFPFHAGVLREGDYQLADGSSRAIEDLPPAIEEPSQVIEDSLPVIEEPPPAPEEPSPAVIEDVSPVIEDISPAIEEPPPAIEEPSPVIADSSPVTEGTSPVIEDSPPVMIPAEMPPPAQPVSAPIPFPSKPAGAVRAPRQRGRIPRTATLVGVAAVILLCAFLIARYRTPHGPEPVEPFTTAAPPVVKPSPAPVPTEPQATETALLLNVQRENGTAILTWNNDASAVKAADSATLLISDGRNQQQLQLGKAELEAGRVVYIPHNREVNFQLQLFPQSPAGTQSVRSVADLPPAPTSDSQSLPSSAAARVPSGDELEPTPPPTIHYYPENAPAAPPPVSQAPAQTGPPPAVTKPAPPQAATLQPQAPKPTPFAEPDKTPPKPREPEVATTVSLELLGRSGIRDVLSPRHIFGFRSDKTVPPRIVRQILPGIFPALASQIHGTREVDVKITIGPGGQVIKADLLDGREADPIDSVVYYAARQWTFEPARSGDRPVESTVLMHFVLKRSS